MGTLSKMMNKIPAAVLRSPLHPLMSKKYLLLSFTGRKSGKKYTTPMSYIREADSFLMTTDSPWWKNLRGGAPVTVRVEGHEHEGIGEARNPTRRGRPRARQATRRPARLREVHRLEVRSRWAGGLCRVGNGGTRKGSGARSVVQSQGTTTVDVPTETQRTVRPSRRTLHPVVRTRHHRRLQQRRIPVGHP
jgi:hypothetical protein